jgi:DNA mismatch endonuclease (patch repair protein)
MDVLTPEQRRLNMSRIRGKNTKPEMLLRRGLHAAGLRFRLHVSTMPGRPDIVLPRYRAVFQIHGCFWHGHDCPLFRMPATRRKFWAKKIEQNRSRDERNAEALNRAGWRVLTVWECSLKGPVRRPLGDVVDFCIAFVGSDEFCAELTGAPAPEMKHEGHVLQDDP